MRESRDRGVESTRIKLESEPSNRHVSSCIRGVPVGKVADVHLNHFLDFGDVWAQSQAHVNCSPRVPTIAILYPA